MFVVIWLLLLAAVETAFVNGDVEANETAKILPNRMVDDGIFQLGVTKVASVPNIQKRQSKSNLANPYIGDIYMITIQIGYPAQSITLSIDTGSSDLWVNPQCSTSGWTSFCNSYPQYDPTKSTSFVPLSQALNLAYGIGAVTGAYATDNFGMGSGPTIKKLQFGVATASNRMFAGIMGVSWGLGLGTGYYNIIDQLALQGLTKTRAFAIDLGNVNTASGTMDFGFAGKIIRVQLAQFIWFNGATCYGPIANAAEKTDVILGDTFMRGAYVVFDQDNANVHIAQAASCGSNIVPITSGTDGVPSVTGACPSPAYSYSTASSFTTTSARTSSTSPSSSRSSTKSPSSSSSSSSSSKTTSSSSIKLALTSSSSVTSTSTKSSSLSSRFSSSSSSCGLGCGPTTVYITVTKMV
ncbi:hypothetical protein EYC84_004386 [Monilinia fructicola]|uniref:Peptidase A1 domain-containing protein n=1 Tax=Monilinia fructicola TaxID=38448 RepID=A0A5M9K412_MONFR|nr:hypothetical protein EYC84_004386 [Monilinia fructicola]